MAADTGATPAQKRRTFEEMLEKGITMLHLDARRPGVDVPPKYRNDFHLRLNFSHLFHLDTFEIDDSGVRASLSFDGRSYLCVIPWDAVFGMTHNVTGQMRIWGNDMPAELLEQAAALAAAAARQQEEAADDIDDAACDDEEDDVLPVGGAIRKVGHLRVIK